MELVYTDSELTPQGVIRDFALDMAFGDDENDFELTMPLPEKRRYGIDRPAVVREYSGEEITLDNANGTALDGLTVYGKAERKVSRNLLSRAIRGTTNYGVTSTMNADGSITMSGTATTNTFMPLGANFDPPLPIGTVVSVSLNNATTNSNSGVYFALRGVNDTGYDATCTFVNADAKHSNVTLTYECQRWGIRVANGANVDGLTFKPQLELGYAATEYEPYYKPYVDVVQGKNLWNPDGKSTNQSGVERYGNIVPAGTYTLTNNSSGNVIYYRDGVSSTSSTGINPNNSVTVTFTDAGVFWCTARAVDVQLERGTTATPYVPYGALEVVSRGKNLLDTSKTRSSYGKEIYGITAERNNDGSVTLHGTATANYAFAIINQSDGNAVDVLGNSPLAISGSTGGVYVQFWSDATKTRRETFTPQSSTNWNVSIYTTSGTNVDGVTVYPQLERGSIATAYEPYTETRTQIDTQGNVLASLPDGTRDELTVDADGRVQLVKRVGVVDFGTQHWTKHNSYSIFYSSNADVSAMGYKEAAKSSMCASFTENTTSIGTMKPGEYRLSDRLYFYSTETDVAAATASVSGVLLYYSLKTPQTIDLGYVEPVRTLNGYTAIKLDSALAAPLTVRYVEQPAMKSYLREVVPELEMGALVYKHGTDIGGIVDTKGYDNTGDVPFVTYSGRTWHGILDASITKPNSGQGYLVLTGDMSDAIGTLISRAGLGDMFTKGGNTGVSVNFQVPRYISVWEALRRLCRGHNMRPYIHKDGGKVVLDAVRKQDYSNGAVSNLTMALQFRRYHRPVNHIVALGQGDLAERTVIDVYADESGNVSNVQSLFGVDEVAEVYENTNEDDAAKLREDAEKRLASYQEFASVGIALPSSSSLDIGDTVTAINVDTGLKALAEVTKKIVTVNDAGTETTNYELGDPIIKSYR